MIMVMVVVMMVIVMGMVHDSDYSVNGDSSGMVVTALVIVSLMRIVKVVSYVCGNDE